MFVRVAPNVDVSSVAEALSHAGFEIVERPRWAPNCAWVSAPGGSANDALAKLDGLAKVTGLSHWEPELLRERALRKPTSRKPTE